MAGPAYLSVFPTIPKTPSERGPGEAGPRRRRPGRGPTHPRGRGMVAATSGAGRCGPSGAGAGRLPCPAPGRTVEATCGWAAEASDTLCVRGLDSRSLEVAGGRDHREMPGCQGGASLGERGSQQDVRAGQRSARQPRGPVRKAGRALAGSPMRPRGQARKATPPQPPGGVPGSHGPPAARGTAGCGGPPGTLSARVLLRDLPGSGVRPPGPSGGPGAPGGLSRKHTESRPRASARRWLC